MKANQRFSRNALAAGVLGIFVSLPVFAAGAAGTSTPSSVNESAPARTGAASVPTGSGAAAGQPVSPARTPSSVSESAPATTGPASTPTQGQGRSAPATQAEGMNRLPKTPSSVSESAPARTGPATVPTARAQSFEAADLNKNGVIDRSEYERMFPAQGATR